MKFALKAVWAVEVISRNYAKYKVGEGGGGQWGGGCSCTSQDSIGTPFVARSASVLSSGGLWR